MQGSKQLFSKEFPRLANNMFKLVNVTDLQTHCILPERCLLSFTFFFTSSPKQTSSLGELWQIIIIGLKFVPFQLDFWTVIRGNSSIQEASEKIYLKQSSLNMSCMSCMSQGKETQYAKYLGTHSAKSQELCTALWWLFTEQIHGITKWNNSTIW